jgi:hypothetical protein
MVKLLRRFDFPEGYEIIDKCCENEFTVCAVPDLPSSRLAVESSMAAINTVV